MDMQREDFLKLCKLPEMFCYSNHPAFKGARYLTRAGFGRANVVRVIGDWFPTGAIVSIEGANFISRGPRMNPLAGPADRAALELIDLKTLQTHSFSVLEALTLAELSIKEQTK